MAYQIINNNIVSQTTQGTKTSFNKTNVDAIVSALKQVNISNIYMQVGILSCVAKECLFNLVDENLNYSTTNSLMKIFPSYFTGTGRPDPSNYINNPEQLSNYIYYNSWNSSNKLLPIGHQRSQCWYRQTWKLSINWWLFIQG